VAVARRERPAVEFAAEILAARSKKISDRIATIEELDIGHCDKLRIAAKKLRYACDFFAGLPSADRLSGIDHWRLRFPPARARHPRAAARKAI
jgi:CHAD domain-containing protein